MKSHIIFALMLMASATCLAQKNDVTKENYTAFLTSETAPHMEKILPEPPAYNSLRYQEDMAMYQWGKTIRNTERGKLALEDAGVGAEYFMKRFSPAMGITLTPQEYPELYRLLRRAHLTETVAGMGIKKFYSRVRPYQLFNEPSGNPSAESPTDFTSYPSGHTHVSWLVGMILTSIDPAHTEEIMKVAYELGQSRIILGFHYQSDVEMGRVEGSITFARLCAMDEFQEMLLKAKKEFQKHTK